MIRCLTIIRVSIIAGLLFVFFKYFGLVSWEKYNSQNVYVAKSWQHPDYIPLPMITVCPSHVNFGHAFKNVTPEQKRRARIEGKGLHEVVCDEKQGKDLIECIEEEVIGLRDIVTFEERHAISPRILSDTVEKNPLVQNHWRISVNHDKGPCFIYQNDQHMETKTILKIGLNASFKYQAFLSDPRFFIYSAIPDIPVSNSFLNAGDWEMIKLRVVAHRNIDVRDKKCTPGNDYSLTRCVRDIFSKQVGCRLHWDRKHLKEDLPTCTTLEQHR